MVTVPKGATVASWSSVCLVFLIDLGGGLESRRALFETVLTRHLDDGIMALWAAARHSGARQSMQKNPSDLLNCIAKSHSST